MADSDKKQNKPQSRQERLAAALRQNLRRRKAQTKGRRDTDKEEPGDKTDGEA